MSTYTSNTLDITSKSTLNSQSFASVASDTKKPPATSIATVIGEGHACNPTTRCAIGLACYLRNATSTATLFNIANEPDATCQLASTPGFILAHPLAANAPLSEHPVPLRWPTFVNGPLAGLGSSCQLMTIPRNNTLKAWLSARNEIDLSIIGNCVENAYCQSDSILNHNATLSGQCKQRLEDHRGCTGHNQVGNNVLLSIITSTTITVVKSTKYGCLLCAFISVLVAIVSIALMLGMGFACRMEAFSMNQPIVRFMLPFGFYWLPLYCYLSLSY
jgi:hypothetical protein